MYPIWKSDTLRRLLWSFVARNKTNLFRPYPLCQPLSMSQ